MSGKSNSKKEIDKSLLLKENGDVVDKNLVIKITEIMNKWNFLFNKFFGVDYVFSGKERGMLKNLCKEFLTSDIVNAMVALFVDIFSDKWYKDRNLVPNVVYFVKNFDYWKSKGLAYSPFINSKSKYWYILNKVNAPLDKISGVDDLFIVDKEGGKLVGYFLENRKLNWRLLKDV